jgi:Fic family protein
MLDILNDKYYADYNVQLPFDLVLPIFQQGVLNLDSFSFYTSVASVFSSKIEGEDIDLNSYIKHRLGQSPFLPNYTKKIDDLFDAYTFAKKHELTLANLLQAHKLISKNLLKPPYRGRIRTEMEFIVNQDGQFEYVAAPPNIVKSETEKLFTDIKELLEADLSISEIFYYASFIHLVFLKIHPFADGNGRSARLLEKWFLAQKLGEKAWFIPSEKYYYDNLNHYYKNIHIGLDYESLDYNRIMPFLLMLPNSIMPKI